MKKAILVLFALLLTAFGAIQFVRPDFTNPPVNTGETFAASAQVPDEVAAILTRSCNDCHSHETVYPWYSKIQPSAWFLADHITEARRELNFSVWATYENRRKRRKLKQICDQVQTREMPLPSYLWMHRDAALTDAQIKMICDWTEAEAAKIVE